MQVGMSLAQIGEFAFVLLSRASNLHLVEVDLKHLFPYFSFFSGLVGTCLHEGQKICTEVRRQ